VPARGYGSRVQSEPSLRRVAIGPARRLAVGGRTRTALQIGAPALLIGVLAWPMLFTGGTLNPDWANHLWYMWNQSQAIRANLRPSFFLNYSHAVFYPMYAFYGGTLYATVGTLSLLLGNAPIETYVLTYLLGFSASYGGWYWMGRMAGLGRWRSHAPGLIFITSAYYLTLIYARGDWPEFIGVSMIPLVLASGLSVLRADRLRVWPALALAASSIVFFGSHNLTMLYGSTLVALLAVAAFICIPQARSWLALRRVIRVAGLVVPALLVNAWFLLPAIVYQSHTEIGSKYPYWRLVLESYTSVVSIRHLFILSRAPALGVGDFVVALPVLAMVWVLIGMAVFLIRGPRGAWTRMLLICAALTVLVGVAMRQVSLILALPRPYGMLQFSYRLESYVLLGISGTVLAVLAVAQSVPRHTRILEWALLPVLVFSVIGGIQQTDAYPPGGNRSTEVKPRSKPGLKGVGLIDYIDAELPILVDPHGQAPEVDFSPASVHGERTSEVVHFPPGEFVDSNIAAGPELVHVTGAKIIGLSPEGGDVLEIDPGAGGAARATAGHRASSETEVISVSPQNGPPMVLGRLLALAGAIFLVGEFAVLATRRVRARGRLVSGERSLG
jgi:hypothetical protein